MSYYVRALYSAEVIQVMSDQTL